MEESVKLAPGGTEGGGGHCWHQGSRVPEHELERAACQQTFQQPPTVTDFNPEVDRFPVQSPNLDFQFQNSSTEDFCEVFQNGIIDGMEVLYEINVTAS